MKAATEDLLKKRSGGGLKIANQSANGLTDENCHAKEYPADCYCCWIEAYFFFGVGERGVDLREKQSQSSMHTAGNLSKYS